jgi:hypothetical protein
MPRTAIYVNVGSAIELEGIAARMAWPVDPDGGLELLLPYYRTSLWATVAKVQQVPCVSVLQLLLDLWHYPLRGREYAELLLEKLEAGGLQDLV